MQNESERAETELSQWLTDHKVVSQGWNGKIANLNSLNLKGNGITSLPESISQLTNTNFQRLDLGCNRLTSLPESIGQLTSLQQLDLKGNGLTSLPELIGQLINLQRIYLSNNGLTSLPKSIGQLINLQQIDFNNNGLTSLPESIGQLTNLQQLDLNDNPLTDLPPLQTLAQENLKVDFLSANLPRRYWTKLSDWQPEWLLDENNAEIRRIIIEQVGYERICTELGASTVDTWREYTLLKIDSIEAVYDGYDYDEPIAWEPFVLLKMNCPSTGHVHMLRVPPEMTSAEAAVTWVNHGIHPDKFAFQT